MESIDVVSILANILAWIILLIFITIKYKKLQNKPNLWLVLPIVIIGMFSFSINFSFKDVFIRLPILPLGVWILFFGLRKREEQWKVYRSFAWIGFLGLFLFIFTHLLTIPVTKAIYPDGELSTYIAIVENSSIVQTHPSAHDNTLNKNELENQIHSMKKEKIESEKWYQEMTMNMTDKKIVERFPYVLIGTLPKWGSGLDHSIIYVEQDGKGLLITAPRGQYYFRSKDSLFKEESQ